MIDLTKPVRCKANPEISPVEVAGPIYRVRFPGGSDTFMRSMDELEMLYENIPEPRKPREWLVYSNQYGDALVVAHEDCCGQVFRVIEWPENAPLPDWPEGAP